MANLLKRIAAKIWIKSPLIVEFESEGPIKESNNPNPILAKTPDGKTVTIFTVPRDKMIKTGGEYKATPHNEFKEIKRFGVVHIKSK